MEELENRCVVGIPGTWRTRFAGLKSFVRSWPCIVASQRCGRAKKIKIIPLLSDNLAAWQRYGSLQ